jgi:hypothetical protein
MRRHRHLWRHRGAGPSETNAFYLLLELYGNQPRDFNAWDTS